MRPYFPVLSVAVLHERSVTWTIIRLAPVHHSELESITIATGPMSVAPDISNIRAGLVKVATNQMPVSVTYRTISVRRTRSVIALHPGLTSVVDYSRAEIMLPLPSPRQLFDLHVYDRTLQLIKVHRYKANIHMRKSQSYKQPVPRRKPNIQQMKVKMDLGVLFGILSQNAGPGPRRPFPQLPP